MDPNAMQLELLRSIDDEHEFGYCFHRDVAAEGAWLICRNCGDYWLGHFVAPWPKLVIRARGVETADAW